MEDGLSPASKVPKYLQISDILRRELARGQWAAGDQLPPCREFVDRFGVTPVTIWKAFDELGREGLIERIRGSGTYVCEPVAAPRLVGVCTRTTGDSFGATADALVRELGAAQRHPLWLSLEGETDRLHPQWQEHLARYLAADLEALVLDGSTYLPFAYLHERLAQLPPLTFMRVCETALPFAGANRVVSDWEAGGYLAGRHLLGAGVERLCYVSFGEPPGAPRELGRPEQYNSRVFAGIQRALREAGRDPVRDVRVVLDSVSDPPSPELGTALAAGYRGVVALGDVRAPKVYGVAAGLGFEVGRDVLVCGYFDTHWAPLQQPGLTSVNIHEAEIAATVARAVSEGWRGRTVNITPTLTVRESTGGLGTDPRKEAVHEHVLV